MTKVLPKEWQVRNIKKKLTEQGVDPDTVDVESLVDPTLSYPENEEAILTQYGTMSESQMWEGSVGGTTEQEIQELKSKTVRRDEVERLIDRKLNKLMEMKRQVQQTVMTPNNQAQVTQANNAIDQEIAKTNYAKLLLEKMKQVRGIGYRKIVKPYKERKETEKAMKQEMQKELLTSLQKGRRMGYYYHGIRMGREQAKALLSKKPKSQPSIQQQITEGIAKRRRDLLIKQEIERQTVMQQMPRRIQQKVMPVKKGKLKGKRIMYHIPPHPERPNPLTGVCMICGRKHRRIL